MCLVTVHFELCSNCLKINFLLNKKSECLSQIVGALAKSYAVKSDNSKIPVHLSKLDNRIHGAGELI